MNRLLLTALGGALALAGTTSNAALLSVNLTTTGGPTESGFTDWSNADKTATSNLVIGGVTLSVAASVDSTVGIRSINRADTYNGTLDNLTQTWWGGAVSSTATGGSLTFDMAGVTAGDYKFTGWHHDHLNQTGEMDIEVSTDGGSTFTLVGDDFGIIDNTTDSNLGAPNPFSFNFTADGTNSVQVRYTNVGLAGVGANGTTFALINGFEVEVVPEPSSLALLGLGGLLIARRRRD